MEPIEGANGESNGESTDGKSNEVNREPAPPEGDILQLTPVPDPDAGADRKQIQAAPSLFDSNDRTANRSARPAWSYSTIAWPDKPTVRTQEPMETEVVEPDVIEENEELDSSGWEAARH